MQAATVIVVVWAGLLIASGMVANAAIAPVAALCGTDPTGAALTWQGIEAVVNGLGGANGEILGGLFTLLVSLAALQAGGFPKVLSILGLLIGAADIISVFPGLTGLIAVYGLSKIVWFVWLGIVLLRGDRSPAA